MRDRLGLWWVFLFVGATGLLPAAGPSTAPMPRQRGEQELLKLLVAASREIDLGRDARTAERLQRTTIGELTAIRDRESPLPAMYGVRPAPWTLALRMETTRRSDLAGLPLRDDDLCAAGHDAAEALHVVSTACRKLELELSQRDPRKPDKLDDHTARLNAIRDMLKVMGKKRPSMPVVGPLDQVLQVQGTAIRAEWVKTLAEWPGEAAVQALARRAVYDLNPEIRKQAIEALRDRARRPYREVLFGALQHPWAPAVEHAALALVALNDVDALPTLRRLRWEDAQAPFEAESGKWFVRETVRVNHLRNCLLCHAPGRAGARVVAPIPGPDELEKMRRGEPIYYSSGRENVCADVTLIKQDFSVVLPVAASVPGPEMQRFDFFVRTRELTADEVAALPKRVRRPSPQKAAIEYARRALEYHLD